MASSWDPSEHEPKAFVAVFARESLGLLLARLASVGGREGSRLCSLRSRSPPIQRLYRQHRTERAGSV